MSQHSTFVPVHINASYEQQPIRVAVSTLSASFPSPADDHLEDDVDLMEWLVRHPGATYWWRVSGDCLADVGILDGDLVAVDRSGTARLGRAVVAEIDGEMTAKLLKRIEGHLHLVPANSAAHYKSYPFTETTKIWGVIAGMCRRYDIE